MRRASALILILALSCVLPGRARAESSDVLTEVGSDLILPTSSADHAKYGLRLAVLISESAEWSPWVVMDSGMKTTGTVNPGAVPVSGAEDLAETNTGSVPLLLRALVRSPTRWGALRLVYGLTWYYADWNNSSIASIPHAPTLGAVWSKEMSRDWQVETYAGLSYQPLGTSALLILPEATGLWRFSSPFHARFGFRLPFYRAAGPLVSTKAIQPSFSAGLEAAF